MSNQPQPRLGVCYYPEHWPENMWEQDAREMVEMGLSLVRIGEFAWSRLEPKEGQFEFEWLDRAIETLGNAGLKVVLGTPSATPPRWVVDKFPDMLAVDKDGNPRKFGSRRHYCFSHTGYREFAAQMAGRLAERYANNDHIEFWQTDNEYGCHDTTISYSDAARKEFRIWLKEKYGNQSINDAWGNVFWSMDYQNFDDVDLPNLTVTEPNPSHVMDFRRFSSDQVARWDLAQIKAIREHCSKPISHNYMGRVTEFDHYKLGENLEIATWDSYPLGFLEDRSDRTEAFKAQYCRTGDPDFQAFHHDLYRAVGRGRWGVMEQQPGPVNWAPYNPAPKPGMVRVWTWEAIAHGAEFVCYFRWRQPPFAQEQMHTALKRPDNSAYPVCDEIRQVAEELKSYQTSEVKADVALIFDYESQWAWEVQPQGKDFNYFKLVYAFYCACRALGLTLDIVSPRHEDFSKYKLVMAPGLYNVSEKLRQAFKGSGAQILYGPRTHSKTENFHLDQSGISELMGEQVQIIHVESLRPSEKIGLKNAGHFIIWNEQLSDTDFTSLQKADGSPAMISNDNLNYLAGWPNEIALTSVLKELLEAARVNLSVMGDGNRTVQKINTKFNLRYDIQAIEIEVN